jgi:hypothetical protein
MIDSSEASALTETALVELRRSDNEKFLATRSLLVDRMQAHINRTQQVKTRLNRSPLSEYSRVKRTVVAADAAIVPHHSRNAVRCRVLCFPETDAVGHWAFVFVTE